MSSLPLKPPREWFDLPEADEPTPLTITAEGQVYGHIALWDTCHTGLMTGDFGHCVKPPRSRTDYSFFHLGELETEEGDISVGRLVYDTTHAPITADLRDAGRHYDKTGAVGAFVRARDGRNGIWVTGAVRSDISPEGLRDLRANPPSGDWRLLNGNLELVGVLAVNTPGFPIPKSQLSLSASADGDLEMASLILPGYCACEEEPLVASARSKGYQRRKKALIAAMLTAKKRNSLPKSSFALPGERAYPIHDLAHARNALARSAGKPESGTVRRAVCRRYPALCK